MAQKWTPRRVWAKRHLKKRTVKSVLSEIWVQKACQGQLPGYRMVRVRKSLPGNFEEIWNQEVNKDPKSVCGTRFDPESHLTGGPTREQVGLIGAMARLNGVERNLKWADPELRPKIEEAMKTWLRYEIILYQGNQENLIFLNSLFSILEDTTEWSSIHNALVNYVEIAGTLRLRSDVFLMELGREIAYWNQSLAKKLGEATARFMLEPFTRSNTTVSQRQVVLGQLANLMAGMMENLDTALISTTSLPFEPTNTYEGSIVKDAILAGVYLTAGLTTGTAAIFILGYCTGLSTCLVGIIGPSASVTLTPAEAAIAGPLSSLPSAGAEAEYAQNLRQVAAENTPESSNPAYKWANDRLQSGGASVSEASGSNSQVWLGHQPVEGGDVVGPNVHELYDNAGAAASGLKNALIGIRENNRLDSLGEHGIVIIGGAMIFGGIGYGVWWIGKKAIKMIYSWTQKAEQTTTGYNSAEEIPLSPL